jgi:hypothetical protein
VNRKRLLLPMLAAVLIGAAAVSTLAAASGPLVDVLPAGKKSSHRSLRLHRGGSKPRRYVNAALVRRLRRTTWHWQNVIGLRHAQSAAALGSLRALHYWRRQVRHVSWLAAHPPHKRGWLCIHRFEGGWSDSGDPYWGGLQMDRGFMRTYAPASLLRKGWANRWTPLEQMWVAERAHRSGRGYGPWPNTARYCGLL